MGKKAWVTKRFDGGWSSDPQLGSRYSFAYSQHLDFRKKPSQLTVLPRTTEEGNGVITDLIQNTVMDLSGNIYALGDQGNFYRRTAAGVWSSEAKLDDGNFGLSYRSDVDKIFIVSSKAISEYSPISSSPNVKLNKYGSSASADSGATLSGGTNTHTLQTSITEDIRRKQDFTCDIEPIAKIRVQVSAKGTGNWTLTLHDALNNTLATSTVNNASITSSRYLDFEFSSQVRIYVKPNARTYHFHLTSTVADGTVYCSESGNLNTCDFTVYADRLIDTRNGMHPMMTFLQYELIGNGNYLSVWEPLSDEPGNTEFLRHKLTFPAGYEVCGIDRYQEYAAIACEKKTDAGNPQEGIIFFWDGLSSTYNYFITVPEGSPYSMHSYKDVLYYEAGGSWYAYAGGSPIKIRTLPDTDSEYSDTTDTTITYPYMATVRRGVHLFGFPSYTTNQSLEHAVYSYGATSKDYPDSFGLNHTISTGTILNASGNLRLGHIKSYGDTLLVSWRDGSDYGLDKVDNNSDPYATASWESLFYDDNSPFKEKTGLYLVATFDALPPDAQLTLKYRTEREGAWTTSVAFTSANTPKNIAKMTITPKRFVELQKGFDLVVSGSQTPIITSLSFMFDDNSSEGLG